MSFPISKQQKGSYYQKFRNSKVRDTVWPIRSFELFKFTPMALLMFVILLNQNIVRSLKDSLVMTMVGAEVISFIKLWGELPIGVLIVVLYSYLCNKITAEKAFRVIFIFFLSFYALFAFVIYPQHQLFHPNPDLVNGLIIQFPNFKWFIIMWGKWSFILLYIMGELWPIIVFSILFWQLANKITKNEEASRFYPFFSIFGQANCLIAGSVIIYFSSDTHFLIPLFDHLSDKTEVLIKSLTSIVLVSGVIALLIQRHIEKKIVLPIQKDLAPNSDINSINHKLSIFESLKLVLKSKYLLYIATLLLSYSLSMNLIEGLWMSKAQQMYNSSDKFIAYQGRILFWTGITTITCALLGSTIIRKLGWIWAATLTPLAMLITGSLFFSSTLLQHIRETISFFGIEIPILNFIIIIGALQFVLSKGFKYSLFDATKEMAYIPLDDETKTKGKASAEILGAKFGKSFGSVIQIIIFSIFPNITYEDIAPVLMILFISVCIIWLRATFKLSSVYKKETSKKN